MLSGKLTLRDDGKAEWNNVVQDYHKLMTFIDETRERIIKKNKLYNYSGE